MKRILFVITWALLCSNAFSQESNPSFQKYGMQFYQELSLMQKYVGDTLIIAPVSDVARNVAGIPHMWGDIGSKHVLLSISPTSGLAKNLTKLKIEVKNIETGEICKKSLPYIFSSISPFVDYSLAKRNAIYFNKEFSHPASFHSYKFEEIELGTGDHIEYIVVDSKTGEFVKKLPEDTNPYQDLFASEFNGKYNVTIESVECSNREEKVSTLKSIEEDGCTKYFYSDDVMKMIIFQQGDIFALSMENLSNSTIKINWDESVFVDRNGYSQRILHGIQNGIIKDEPQVPTTLIKGGKIVDVIQPLHQGRAYGPIWPVELPNKKEIYSASIMLSLQTVNGTRDYIINFKSEYEFDHPENLNIENWIK